MTDLVVEEPRRAWLGAEAHVRRPRGFHSQRTYAPASKTAVVLAGFIGAVLGAGATALLCRLSRRTFIP